MIAAEKGVSEGGNNNRGFAVVYVWAFVSQGAPGCDPDDRHPKTLVAAPPSAPQDTWYYLYLQVAASHDAES
jgi:hypothetical protein